MNAYQRIFGSGPFGILCSIALVLPAALAQRALPSGALGIPAPVRWAILAVASLATPAGILWSMRSLPVDQRGRELCIRGAFRWVRHPLYASLLSVGVPGLALFLDHWIWLAWVAAVHLLWHVVIRSEERMMEAEFGEAYRSYARRTGRFVPRVVGRAG